MPFKKRYSGRKPKRTYKKRYSGGKTKSTYKRRSFKSKRRTSRKNAGVSKMIKTYAETYKKIGVPVVDGLPSALTVHPTIFHREFDYANASLTNPFGTHLNCTSVTQGLGANMRTGDYVYFKSIQGALRIKVNSSASATPQQELPIRFRCIWFKNKRVYSPTGSVSLPGLSIFLTPDGKGIGPDSSGALGTTGPMTEMQFFTAPFNLRHFNIIKSKDFTLSPASVVGPVGGAPMLLQGMSNLPSHKIIKFNLPINQKCKYDNRTDNVEDRDVHLRLLILSMPTGGSLVYPADGWTVSMDSVGLYTDL